VDAHSNGFHVSVVEECVFDRSEMAHKTSLFDLHHKYADVMNLSEVIEGLKAA
jgi:isochorismate hydrolase